MPQLEQFLKVQDVINMTKIPKSTIYARAKAGTMPAPIKVSERSSVWRLSDVQKWMTDPAVSLSKT